MPKDCPPSVLSVFLIKDQKQNVLGGISGTSFYGSLYIDSLCVITDGEQNSCKRLKKLEENAMPDLLQLTPWIGKLSPFTKSLAIQSNSPEKGYDKKSKMFMLRKSL
ncbi:MAG TPA: hypothetical protein VGJ00_07465 [Rhabdochlamydiaceae bacterium]|jgi:hypothetical protein